jgi:hypothetical protein
MGGMSALYHKQTHAPQQNVLFDYFVGAGRKSRSHIEAR